MNPPKIVFKGRPDSEVRLEVRESSNEIILTIIDRVRDVPHSFLYSCLDLSTAQSLKKHLGWLIAHAKNQGYAG